MRKHHWSDTAFYAVASLLIVALMVGTSKVVDWLSRLLEGLSRA